MLCIFCSSDLSLHCCISDTGSLCAISPLQVQGASVVYLNIASATGGTIGGSSLSVCRKLALGWVSSHILVLQQVAAVTCFLVLSPSFSKPDKVLITVVSVSKCWNRSGLAFQIAVTHNTKVYLYAGVSSPSSDCC